MIYISHIHIHTPNKDNSFSLRLILINSNVNFPVIGYQVVTGPYLISLYNISSWSVYESLTNISHSQPRTPNKVETFSVTLILMSLQMFTSKQDTVVTGSRLIIFINGPVYVALTNISPLTPCISNKVNTVSITLILLSVQMFIFQFLVTQVSQS